MATFSTFTFTSGGAVVANFTKAGKPLATKGSTGKPNDDQ
jgi:hypothetical protein